MSAELYFNPFCTACGGGEATTHPSGPVRWIDATQHLEAAAGLGITRLPALVVNGKLVAQGPRALTQMRNKLSAGGAVR